MGLNNFLEEMHALIDNIVSSEVTIQKINVIPDTIPLDGNHWLELDEISCVFVDMVGSTGLNASTSDSVKIYETFIKSLVKILSTFEAQYIDIKGDGAFGIFSGKDSAVPALCAAVTFYTVCRRFLEDKFNSFKIQMHAGIDTDRVLVKRIGLRGEKNNEVWVGKPVNIAAKLASIAPANTIYVSERTYSTLSKREYSQYLIKSCGCPNGQRNNLWESKENNFPFLRLSNYYSLGSQWCLQHGEQFCQEVIDIYRKTKKS